MEFDIFNLLLTAIVFSIYGSICMISIIFTFSLDIYIKIHDVLNFYVFSTPILTPIEQSIDWLDSWAMSHNKILGPILIILSIIDLKLLPDLIKVS